MMLEHYLEEQARMEQQRHLRTLKEESEALRNRGLRPTENFQFGDRTKPGLNWVMERND